MISFPTSLDTLTNPTASDDTSTVSHASQHANANDAIEALEAKVGINSSAVATSLDYKVTNTSSLDPGHKHTPTVSLAITGTPDGTKFLRDDNTWSDPPTAADATSTTTGLVELATSSEINAGTATGGDGPLTVTPDQLAASNYASYLPSSGQKDALAGSAGTPGSANTYITEDDVSDAAGSGLIVRATGTALPALSGANLTSLPVSKRLASSTSNTTVASSTTETSIGSFTLTGGLLSTANVVDFWIPITALGIQSGESTTIRAKYGSTTLCSISLSSGGVTGYVGSINFRLMAAGSATAQEGYLTTHISSNDDTLGDASIFTFMRQATGTATETSSGDLTVNITIQHSNNNALDNITVGGYNAILHR